MNSKNLQDILKDFPKKKILVIGDVMLDQYTFGNVTRISPEAPVPVIQKTSEKFVLGGAANVANNISALGGNCYLIGIVGKDRNKQLLLDLLNEGKVNAKFIITSESKQTSLKNRILAGEVHQIIRFDDENEEQITKKEEERIMQSAKTIMPKIDALILSDYAKGLFTPTLTPKLIQLAKKYKKPIIADIKPQNKKLFKGVNIIAPNLKEAMEMTGEKDLKRIGKKLTAIFNANALITLGSEGMVVFHKNGLSKKIPVKKVRVFDVSGAGDTVVATLTLSISAGLNLDESAKIAAQASELVVQKLGTATVSNEELLSSLGDSTRHVDDVSMHPKLWGYEKWLENNDKYCCKLLVLNKGYQCSLHYHNEKDEMFYVSKGHVRLESDGKISYMREGNFTRILPGTRHRFRGIEDSVIIEVSTHHEEEDSHRIEESKKVE